MTDEIDLKKQNFETADKDTLLRLLDSYLKLVQFCVTEANGHMKELRKIHKELKSR